MWSAPRADDRPSPNFGIISAAHSELRLDVAAEGALSPGAGAPSAIMSSRHAALIAEAEAPATPSHSKVRVLAQPLQGFGSEATEPS